MTSAKVFCVVPVYNRRETTKRFLEYMTAQDYPAIEIVIVDDGSTDGTGAYLRTLHQENLTVLTGDGGLWWSGGMQLGMDFVAVRASDADFLLMLNDDVRIERDFVSTLVKDSGNHGGAVIVAAQYNDVTGDHLASGYRIDFWATRFESLYHDTQTRIDAAPGRGVLFPYAAIRRAGPLFARLFPQCMSDLEYTSRVREKGWKLAISRDARVHTPPVSSIEDSIRAKGWIAWRFSLRSKGSVVLRLFFFSLRGPVALRLWALPRLLLMGAFRLMRGPSRNAKVTH
jgi:GT2 family glycosyltransferase